jgi:hypothetical protein
MIELSEQEVRWIKLCKGHYTDLYRTNAKNWIETLKPMFREIYAYEPNEFYRDFLDCMFHKLFDIYMKIKLDQSGTNVQLKEIISAGFEKTWRREYELPIERVIAELCGQIQCNTVIEDGVYRYCLEGEIVENCVYYDEAQGRHKCTCKATKRRKCTGVCEHHKSKENEK